MRFCQFIYKSRYYIRKCEITLKKIDVDTLKLCCQPLSYFFLEISLRREWVYALVFFNLNLECRIHFGVS